MVHLLIGTTHSTLLLRGQQPLVENMMVMEEYTMSISAIQQVLETILSMYGPTIVPLLLTYSLRMLADLLPQTQGIQ